MAAHIAGVRVVWPWVRLFSLAVTNSLCSVSPVRDGLLKYATLCYINETGNKHEQVEINVGLVFLTCDFGWVGLPFFNKVILDKLLNILSDSVLETFNKSQVPGGRIISEWGEGGGWQLINLLFTQYIGLESI